MSAKRVKLTHPRDPSKAETDYELAQIVAPKIAFIKIHFAEPASGSLFREAEPNVSKSQN